MRAESRSKKPLGLMASIGLVIVGTNMSMGAPLSSEASTEEPTSAAWWRARAAQFCEEIEDADTRSDAFYTLAYANGHAMDLDAAKAAAMEVSKPLKAIYALTFVARRFHKQGDADEATKLLEAARQASLRHRRKDSNFASSHLIDAYIELGRSADARAYIRSFIGPVQQSRAGGDLLAAEVKHGLFDIEKRQLSESGWSDVARAFARQGRIKETLAAAERLSNAEKRDRVFSALADYLVEHNRWREAQPVVDLIKLPEVRSKAEGQVLTEWAKEQTSEVIAARLEQVATRREKEALYNQLIEKRVAEGRLEEAESAIAEMVDVMESSPRPAEVSAFGQFDDACAIATAKSNHVLIAKAHATKGDQAAAKEQIERAADPIMALEASAGLGKMMLVMRLVEAQIAIGDLEGARSNLADQQSFIGAMPVTLLAASHAKIGNVKPAVEAAHLISEDYKGRGDLYGTVAEELIRGGDTEAARQLLAELDATAEEAVGYRDAGEAMMELGDADGLRKWADEMESPVHQVFACLGAAKSLAATK